MWWNGMHAMWCDVRLGDVKATTARTQFCKNVLTLMIFQSSKIPTTIYVHTHQKLKVKRLKTLPSMYWWWWWWVSVFSFPGGWFKHRFLSVYLCLESCCFFTLFLRFPRSNVVNATSSYDPIPLSGAQRNMRSWALDSLSSLPKVSKKPASWGVLEAGMMTW